MAYPSAAERINQTLRLLEEHGHVSVSHLSEQFAVSEVTIRKDLRDLERKNLLLRTHGGAVSTNHYVSDLPFEEKAKHHSEEKKRIGRAAADLIEDEDCFVLDSGTTTLQIARNLKGKRHLTVTTNSIHVALELLHVQDIDLLILGGITRRSSASVVGPYAEQMLHDHSFRKLFLAVDGFDTDYGLTTTHTLEAHINQCMIEASQQTIVVTDSSKFGRRGMSRICGLGAVDMVITDDGAPERVVKTLQEQGIEVLVI